MNREFIDVKDRLTKFPNPEKQFGYMTRMSSTKVSSEDVIATIALIHGFSEHSSNSMFEVAMEYALNGFEVIMIDLKGQGLSSGLRAGGFKVYESHEYIGALLTKARNDKPLFMHCHSMGC